MGDLGRRWPMVGPRMSGLKWAKFLAEFHAAKTSITGRVLARTTNGELTPYQWLARSVGQGAETILDVGCGSGRCANELRAPSRQVIGLDISMAELRQAAEKTPGPWVRGDATRLPFADNSFDAVVSVMGLAVIRPLNLLLDEMARVLRPGGVFVSITPTFRKINFSQFAANVQVIRRLGTVPRFPNWVEFSIAESLTEAGLTRAEDLRARFCYPVNSERDAAEIIDALYLPGVSKSRKQAAVDYLSGMAGETPLEIPIGVRRIVAVK